MYGPIDAIWQRRVAQLLNLAAHPYSRFRVFDSTRENLFVYMYDSMNEDEFGGLLSFEDGRAVEMIVEKMIAYTVLDIKSAYGQKLSEEPSEIHFISTNTKTAKMKLFRRF